MSGYQSLLGADNLDADSIIVDELDATTVHVSKYLYVDSPATAIINEIIIPTGAQNGYILTSDAIGAATWQPPSISILAGDVTGLANANTVALVGGKPASEVATAVSDVQAATAINTASAIVKRSAAGNIASSTFTGALIGNASTATNTSNVSTKTASAVVNAVAKVEVATQAATPSTLVMRDVGGNAAFSNVNAINFFGKASTVTTNANLSGDVTSIGNATTVVSVGGQTAENVATAVNNVQQATQYATADTIVKRDAVSNINANTFTGSLIGNAETVTTNANLTGQVTSIGNATTVVSVGGQTAAKVASGAILANAATSLNTSSAIVQRDETGAFSATKITATGNITASTITTTGNLTASTINASGLVALSQTGATKKLCVYDGGTIGSTTDPRYYGFGISAGAMDYYCEAAAAFHVWRAGLTATNLDSHKLKVSSRIIPS